MSKTYRFHVGSTYLEDDQEEQSVDQDAPDGNVGQDASWQRVSIHSNGSIPVQGDKVPGQGSSDGGDVDRTRVCIVAEVERGQVEEINDGDHLGPDKVAADEEHGPAELQEVVEDEVGSHARGGLDMVAVLGEEVPHVTDLGKEEGEPGFTLAEEEYRRSEEPAPEPAPVCAPVQRAHQGIEGEGGRECLVLTPDGVAPELDIVLGYGKGVVDAGDDDEEPGDDGEDFVGPDSLDALGFASSEGVCWRTSQRNLGQGRRGELEEAMSILLP